MSDAANQALAGSEGSVHSNGGPSQGTSSPPSLAKQSSTSSHVITSQAPKIDDESKQDIVDLIWKGIANEVESKYILYLQYIPFSSYGCYGD